jgi:hypothetical protein
MERRGHRGEGRSQRNEMGKNSIRRDTMNEFYREETKVDFIEHGGKP